jgi:hypothetical protein
MRDMLTSCSPRIIPTTMPTGDAQMKAMKVIKLETSFHFLLCERKVVPTEQATGTLWITTLIAKTVIAESSLKTPIANPSMKLCRVMATPKATREWEETL